MASPPAGIAGAAKNPWTSAARRPLRETFTMAEKTIFKRIIDREVPADIVHEDEHCLAFRDIAPQAPTHFLVVPKREIASLDALTDNDAPLLGHICTLIPKLAAKLGLERGYRVVINCGPHGGQSVDHLHFHVLGGRPLAWPPG
jgi:histidine triad (HIT) family protein